MLVQYSGSQDHVRMHAEFEKRLGNSMANGEFKNPFAYYKHGAEADVTLWLLISEQKIIASVITKRQRYLISGIEKDAYFLKYPVSLSNVDPDYTFAAAQLSSAIKKQFKYSFLLGMGGIKSKTAKFFAASRFVNIEIPFFLKFVSLVGVILHNPIVSKISPLKNKIPKQFNGMFINDGIGLKRVDDFKSGESWRDSVFSLIRTSSKVNAQTPQEELPFLKFDIEDEGGKIGSLIVIETTPRRHKFFGNLNLWTVLELEVNCGKDVSKTVSKNICTYARKRGVDVIIMNSGAKKHKRFCTDNSWLSLPTNFCISLSPSLAKSLGNNDIYVTRLDGDGPINLGTML